MIEQKLLSIRMLTMALYFTTYYNSCKACKNIYTISSNKYWWIASDRLRSEYWKIDSFEIRAIMTRYELLKHYHY